jgi:hypothetical protein
MRDTTYIISIVKTIEKKSVDMSMLEHRHRQSHAFLSPWISYSDEQNEQRAPAVRSGTEDKAGLTPPHLESAVGSTL